MKKLYTLVLVIGLSTYTFSQDIKYGVHFGTNVSNMDYKEDGIMSNPHRNGFVFGAFVDFGLTETLAVMTELQYSPEGANLQNFKTDYLNLPVILNYNIVGGLKLGVGPQVGLKVHKHDDGFKNFAFSGVGFAEYMLTDEFGIDFRYLYGITNVFNDDINLEATQGVMQFGVTYRL
ncbi:outer membrane protein with beta-barrel domain [Gelidibacter sediminis]|uniref:Outer membrane protein with beta-barrel domain n=1 Tax=Gelidibacter sediminis TaxID=1608710 RepID=A0A4R7PYX5_9FLAO|nr:outer membrane beta-barrel protein [Gelidibacter sediminis]TDU40215.1 outer membrane protein with beta-barrel domain [Gelidibacter sediminis]